MNISTSIIFETLVRLNLLNVNKVQSFFYVHKVRIMHLTVFLLILLGSASYGMDNTPSAPADSNKTCKISTEKLIDSVLKTHPSVQASRQLILGSNAQVEGAKWNYYPTPSVDVSMASGRRNTTVRLDQPLWTGGKLDAAYNLALSRKNESETILSESSYQLADTLLSLLRSYLQATGNLQALEEGKNDLQSFEAMLERRIDAGVSALSDRELIRSRLAQIDADIASARARAAIPHRRRSNCCPDRNSTAPSASPISRSTRPANRSKRCAKGCSNSILPSSGSIPR